MLSFAGNLRVFVALEPCDMRKSFNGLQSLVSERLAEDPMQGAVFAFTNKNRTRLKLLYWDGTGLWVMAKRLEKGSFSWPKVADPKKSKLKLAPEALSLLMDGIDMKDGCLRPWYERA
ncbi:MAG: IS66 family insertion sequence element accessory protein TnpB [Akkermansiaceae bacterium]|nr:IS66 family insertion sequence element accessory protein TnpB [Akkermansiaceae bacterium]